MMNKFRHRLMAGIIAAGLVIGTPAVGRQGSDCDTNDLVHPLPQGVIDRYELVEKLISNHASAFDVGDALYWPDVIIDGEGGPTQHGFDEMLAAMPETLEFVGDNCKFVFTDPAIVTEHVVVQRSGFNCKMGVEPDVDLRLLYVWQKRGETWKVVRESYTNEIK